MSHDNSTELAKVWARGEDIKGFLGRTLSISDVGDGLNMIHDGND